MLPGPQNIPLTRSSQAVLTPFHPPLLPGSCLVRAATQCGMAVAAGPLIPDSSLPYPPLHVTVRRWVPAPQADLEALAAEQQRQEAEKEGRLVAARLTEAEARRAAGEQQAAAAAQAEEVPPPPPPARPAVVRPPPPPAGEVAPPAQPPEAAPPPPLPPPEPTPVVQLSAAAEAVPLDLDAGQFFQASKKPQQQPGKQQPGGKQQQRPATTPAAAAAAAAPATQGPKPKRPGSAGSNRAPVLIEPPTSPRAATSPRGATSPRFGSGGHSGKGRPGSPRFGSGGRSGKGMSAAAAAEAVAAAAGLQDGKEVRLKARKRFEEALLKAVAELKQQAVEQNGEASGNANGGGGGAQPQRHWGPADAGAVAEAVEAALLEAHGGPGPDTRWQDYKKRLTTLHFNLKVPVAVRLCTYARRSRCHRMRSQVPALLQLDDFGAVSPGECRPTCSTRRQRATVSCGSTCCEGRLRRGCWST